jgi:hypothetical protein
VVFVRASGAHAAGRVLRADIVTKETADGSIARFVGCRSQVSWSDLHHGKNLCQVNTRRVLSCAALRRVFRRAVGWRPAVAVS